MKKPLEALLRDACDRATKGGELLTTTLPPLLLSVPKEAEHGDLASNLALALARGEKRPPRAVAETIVKHLDDRMNGDMTIVDFPASFPFTMTDGKVSMKTSADAILNGIGQPGLPHCSSLELVYLAINDPAGTQFADVGLFLP